MAPVFDTSKSNTDNNIPQQQFAVVERKPDHHYRTEIPNIIYSLGLDPYELTLYNILKKVAGDGGACWQTIKTLAIACRMSERKVQDCLKKLSSPIIDKIPLITLDRRKNADGSYSSNMITIVDIWRINGEFFKGGGAWSAVGGGAPHAPGGAPHAPKEEPIKQEPKQQQQAAIAAPAAVIFDCLKNLQIPESEKTWLSAHYPEAELVRAVAWATAPTTKISKSLEQALKWWLKSPNKPIAGPNPEEVKQKHCKDAHDVEKKIYSDTARFIAASTFCQIYPNSNLITPIIFEYGSNNFHAEVWKMLQKYEFKDKNTL